MTDKESILDSTGISRSTEKAELQIEALERIIESEQEAKKPNSEPNYPGHPATIDEIDEVLENHNRENQERQNKVPVEKEELGKRIIEEFENIDRKTEEIKKWQQHAQTPSISEIKAKQKEKDDLAKRKVLFEDLVGPMRVPLAQKKTQTAEESKAQSQYPNLGFEVPLEQFEEGMENIQEDKQNKNEIAKTANINIADQVLNRYKSLRRELAGKENELEKKLSDSEKGIANFPISDIKKWSAERSNIEEKIKVLSELLNKKTEVVVEEKKEVPTPETQTSGLRDDIGMEEEYPRRGFHTPQDEYDRWVVTPTTNTEEKENDEDEEEEKKETVAPTPEITPEAASTEDTTSEIREAFVSEKELRKRKIWDMIYQVAGGAIGAKTGMAFGGAVIAATGSPIAIAGIFVAGTILFMKRKDVGQFMGGLMERRIEALRRQQQENPSPENLKILERNKRYKEILTSAFTGLAGGAGAGLVFGGYSAVSDLVNGVYAAESVDSATLVGEGAEIAGENTVEVIASESPNFGELGESIHLIDDMNLDPGVIEQAISEGRLLGPNLLLKGGDIASLQGTFLETLNGTSLGSVDLSTPENTKTFVDVIYEINRQVMAGNPINEEIVRSIAERTIGSFQ